MSTNARRHYAEAEALPDRAAELEFAEQDDDSQLAIGVAGEQRALPGPAAPRPDHRGEDA